MIPPRLQNLDPRLDADRLARPRAHHLPQGPASGQRVRQPARRLLRADRRQLPGHGPAPAGLRLPRRRHRHAAAGEREARHPPAPGRGPHSARPRLGGHRVPGPSRLPRVARPCERPRGARCPHDGRPGLSWPRPAAHAVRRARPAHQDLRASPARGRRHRSPHLDDGRRRLVPRRVLTERTQHHHRLAVPDARDRAARRRRVRLGRRQPRARRAHRLEHAPDLAALQLELAGHGRPVHHGLLRGHGAARAVPRQSRVSRPDRSDRPALRAADPCLLPLVRHHRAGHVGARRVHLERPHLAGRRPHGDGHLDRPGRRHRHRGRLLHRLEQRSADAADRRLPRDPLAAARHGAGRRLGRELLHHRADHRHHELARHRPRGALRRPARARAGSSSNAVEPSARATGTSCRSTSCPTSSR